jgi:hypothetical protein
MSKKLFILIISVLAFNSVQSQEGFDYYKQNKSLNYSEAISLYKQLASKHPKKAKLMEKGTTDSGFPLHVFVISGSGDFDPVSLKKKDKRIIMINNGIHAGEPCGIDASVNFARDVLSGKGGMDQVLENVVFCIIPVYNIGGALNRGCCSRANQNGPEEYGFRGNSKNLDLNRDFIKCNSENAKSFSRIFHQWKPDIFIDTHTTNGADYQYVMTLIATQKDKLHPALSEIMNEKMLPELYSSMEKAAFPMTPYVYSVSETPDTGLIGFLETPRYSTGYAALFNTIGFVTEAHMLKPFERRVEATYAFFNVLSNYVNRNSQALSQARKEAERSILEQNLFALNWSLDTSRFELITFKGYEAKYVLSKVTEKKRLYYDTLAPYEKPIKYFNHYNASAIVQKPKAYLIPQAHKEVIERLKINDVRLKRLEKDSVFDVEMYYIENYKSPDKPFEGHYLHSNVTVSTENGRIKAYKGDYLVETQQPGVRYIIETLEPRAVDSFFAWNFFDEILQQKEWFSSYVFEPLAEELLINNRALKNEFEQKKLSDPKFSEDAFAQLYFIYKNSPYFEKEYLRHPIFRIL